MIKDKKYLIDNKVLMNEWDWVKNNEININPEKLTLGSEKKVWWICNICKNSWFADIGHRSHGRGCPQCANVKRLQTRILNNGSLADFNPELCKEWNYEKNNGLTPHDFMPSSGKIVWWKCLSCSHEWKASICNRNSKNNKTKCPNCSLIYQSSIAEKVVFFYIKKYLPMHKKM